VIPLGIGAGLALGLLLAILAEATDRRVRFPIDLEFAASGPFLGNIETVQTRKRGISPSWLEPTRSKPI
jgi:capsular polysaccharide biosynthesis protein